MSKAFSIGFTGAEIAALVPDALYAAFADGKRQIQTKDLIGAARTVVPLSKTAAEKIEELRKTPHGHFERCHSDLCPSSGRHFRRP
jgi:SpoVK/Ycf46/Vps4 family AAA+-type ATPase